MGTLVKESVNFYKTVSLLVDTGGKLLTDIIEEYCRTNALSFPDFLERHQHDVFHYWNKSICCQCAEGSHYRPFLQEKQWHILYKGRPSTCCSIFRKCPKTFIPDPTVTTAILDISLSSSLVLNIIPVDARGKDLIRQLKEHRNNLYGHATETKLSDEVFEDEWQKIKHTLCNIKNIYLKTGITSLSDEIGNLYTLPLQCEVASLLQILREWTKSDGDIVKELQELKEILRNAGIDKFLPRLDTLSAAMPEGVGEEIKELKRFVEESMVNNSLDNNAILGRLKRIEDLADLKFKKSIDHTREEIDNHRRRSFVSTRAVTKGKEKIEKGILIYSGMEGSGKSRNSLEILHMIQTGEILEGEWNIVRLTSINEIENDVNTTEKTVIFIDQILQNSCDVSEFMRRNSVTFDRIAAGVGSGRLKFVACIRSDVMQRCKEELERHQIFSEENIIELSSVQYCLTEKERMNMLEEYCKFHDVTIHENGDVIEISNENEVERVDEISREMLKEIVKIQTQSGFPLYCHRFFNKVNRSLGPKLFKQPTQKLLNDVNDMIYKDAEMKRQFRILVSMLLHGKPCTIIEIGNKLIDMECELVPSGHQREYRREFEIIDTMTIKTDLDKMKGKLVDQKNDKYRFQHDAVLAAVFITCGNMLQELFSGSADRLLHQCDIQLVYDFVRTQSCQITENEKAWVLKEALNRDLVERFFVELRLGNVYSVLSHKTMEDESFVELFVSTLVKSTYIDIFETPYVGDNPEERYSLLKLTCQFSPPCLLRHILKINEYYERDSTCPVRSHYVYRRVPSYQPLCSPEMVEDGYYMACCRGNSSVVYTILSEMDTASATVIAKGLNEACIRGKTNAVIAVLTTRMDLKSVDIAHSLAQATTKGHLNVMEVILNRRIVLSTEVLQIYMQSTVDVFLNSVDDEQRRRRKEYIGIIANILQIRKEIPTEFLRDIILTGTSWHDSYDMVNVVLHQRPDISNKDLEEILMKLAKRNRFLGSLRTILEIRTNMDDEILTRVLVQAARSVDGTDFIRVILNTSRNIGQDNILRVLENVVGNATNDPGHKPNIEVLVKAEPVLTKANILQVLLLTLMVKKHHLTDAIFSARRDLDCDDVTYLLLDVIKQLKDDSCRALGVVLTSFSDLTVTQTKQVLNTILCHGNPHQSVNVVFNHIKRIPSCEIVSFAIKTLQIYKPMAVLERIFHHYKEFLNTENILDILRSLIQDSRELTECLHFILDCTVQELKDQDVRMLFLELVNKNPSFTSLAECIITVRNDISAVLIVDVLRKACENASAPKMAEVILQKKKGIEKETVVDILESLNGKTEHAMVEVLLRCRRDLGTRDLKRIMMNVLHQAESPIKLDKMMKHGKHLSQSDLTDVMIAALDHDTRGKVISLVLNSEQLWSSECIERLCTDIIGREDPLDNILDIVLSTSGETSLVQKSVDALLLRASNSAHVKKYMKIILQRVTAINEVQIRKILLLTMSSRNAASIHEVILKRKSDLREDILQECLTKAIGTTDGNVIVETIMKLAKSIKTSTVVTVLNTAAEIEGGVVQAKSILEMRKEVGKDKIKSLLKEVIFRSDAKESVCCILDSRADLKPTDVIPVLRLSLNIPNGHIIMKEILHRKCPDQERMLNLFESAIAGCYCEQLGVLIDYSKSMAKESILQVLDMTINLDVSDKSKKIELILNARKDIEPEDVQGFLMRVLKVADEPDMLVATLKGRDDMSQWRYGLIFNTAACKYKRLQCVRILLADDKLRSNVPAKSIEESFLKVATCEKSLRVLEVLLDNQGWSNTVILSQALDNCLQIHNGSKMVNAILKRNIVPINDVIILLDASIKMANLKVLETILNNKDIPTETILESLQTTLELLKTSSGNFAEAGKIIFRKRQSSLSQEEIDTFLREVTTRRNYGYLHTVLPVLSNVSVENLINYTARNMQLKQTTRIMRRRSDLYRFPVTQTLTTAVRQRLFKVVFLLLIILMIIIFVGQEIM